ncbi:hypothetical protein TNCV_4130961 [Trichonephila clavipes]|nr:hypothetical protein TNCV_4130961 [Trichonephila clavipes]
MDGDSPHLTQLPDDMSFSESDSEDGMEDRRSPSPLPPPPSITGFKNNLVNCQYSILYMNIGLDIQNSIRRIDMYHFDDEEEKKKYVAELNALFAESRTRFHELRRIELENGNQLFDFPEPPHQNVRSQQQDEGAFQLVKGRKKGRSPTPPKDTATSLEKQKTTEVETSNQYDALPTYHGEENEDETEVPVHHNTVRPPPPITIDNVKLPNQLLKKLQDTTQQKMKGRMVGKGLRIYPETPEAYHAIRKYVETEKLEAFTYQLPEDREIKAVIRGMPADTPRRNNTRSPDGGNQGQ